MESKDIMKYLPQILLAIGAIIGIAAFFLAWQDGVTGKDLLDNKVFDSWEKYIPVIILVLGIVALIVGALPHFGVEMDAKVLNGIIAVIGIIMIILFAVLYMKKTGDVQFGSKAAVGMWLGLVAGLVPVIVGILGFFNVFDSVGAPKVQ